ncbi:MAG: phosphoribosylamine--glycine ligase [Deltaproteobacteria bacterium]|nr:phosphoribosylamine--glycine ligase [Deltaproteobacteria bacterium]
MKILVVGSGGREHALVWKIKQSTKFKTQNSILFCAPGNAGIAQIAECVDIKVEDIDRLLSFAKKEGIDLTVVGPEVPLTAGIVDEFENAGLRIFGASRRAAEIEGSKAFSKAVMKKYGIPTAEYEAFTEKEKAISYVKAKGAPIVVKASGLAAGKGVIVASTLEEAIDAVNMIMGDKAFGAAGDEVVIEEFLEGEEVSFLAFTDGKIVLPMPSAQDHKRIYDNDEGPNTGGMGVYSPAPVLTDELRERVMKEIMLPTVQGMASEGRPYKGVLYAGLMMTRKGPKALEFNARFGDPETQPLMMRMKSDIIEVMEAVIDERLSDIRIEWDNRASVCVVMAAGGYPGDYKKGDEIKGLDDAAKMNDVMVFHAGTALKDGKVVTNGGRVLGVTALGNGIKEAIDSAYQAVSKINWNGVHYRKDIGRRALSAKA